MTHHRSKWLHENASEKNKKTHHLQVTTSIRCSTTWGVTVRDNAPNKYIHLYTMLQKIIIIIIIMIKQSHCGIIKSLTSSEFTWLVRANEWPFKGSRDDKMLYVHEHTCNTVTAAKSTYQKRSNPQHLPFCGGFFCLFVFLFISIQKKNE